MIILLICTSMIYLKYDYICILLDQQGITPMQKFTGILAFLWRKKNVLHQYEIIILIILSHCCCLYIWISFVNKNSLEIYRPHTTSINRTSGKMLIVDCLCLWAITWTSFSLLSFLLFLSLFILGIHSQNMPHSTVK